MNETNQKKYWVGADVVFIPGREAGELAEVHGITDPERQEVVLEGGRNCYQCLSFGSRDR